MYTTSKVVTERKINGKSLLEVLGTALCKVSFTQPTDINGTVMHLMPMKEYDSKDQFVKNHKYVLKELGVKNAIQLIYLLFIFDDIIAKHDTSMKNHIDQTFQKQVAQFEATEASNDTPVSTLV
ncbi:unnamed protein product [Rhizophagus irregularis]|uniref:Uncharacterized protein n=1 Tax=Rhizophagus irregularis TaxID=588596 RepID=A0A2N1ML34_9GLOM|nr:hypothetical protein RhiirC2_790503 [Rhizophagus irregularis]CAB4382627.1 unnamed protein product [Rhizophagus irregularis]CAB5371764.1 unnamed protein product [Rhizophagus irregularis]